MIKTYGEKLRILILVSLAITLITGCATSGMRNGVAQTRYELSKLATSDQSVARADSVLVEWQKSYGEADRTINDNSYYPVIEQMQGEARIMSQFEGFGTDWLTTLVGGGGLATIAGLALKLLTETRKRKEIETAAQDCTESIETIKDEKVKKEVKEIVRKKQAARLPLNKIVNKEKQ